MPLRDRCDFLPSTPEFVNRADLWNTSPVDVTLVLASAHSFAHKLIGGLEDGIAMSRYQHPRGRLCLRALGVKGEEDVGRLDYAASASRGGD